MPATTRAHESPPSVDLYGPTVVAANRSAGDFAHNDLIDLEAMPVDTTAQSIPLLVERHNPVPVPQKPVVSVVNRNVVMVDAEGPLIRLQLTAVSGERNRYPCVDPK
jgi:hypothetical protein